MHTKNHETSRYSLCELGILYRSQPRKWESRPECKTSQSTDTKDGSPMNLSDLEAFVSVVDHGSVVAAAAWLHLTQSAVTRRIQNLEDALGMPLLDRKTRPLLLTRAGQETYEFAKPVLSSVNDLKVGILHGGEPSGNFRFGMSRALGDLAIGAPISRLRGQFPRVQIQAFVQWSAVLLERLTTRTLDAGIVLLPEGTTPPDSLVSERLGNVPLTFVAAKTERIPQPTTLKELAFHKWLINPSGCSSHQMLEAAFRQRAIPFVIAVEAEGYELQLSLISEGVGLGLMLPQAIETSALRGRVRAIRVKDFSPVLSVWLLHSRHLGRLIQAVHCVREEVKQKLKTRRSPNS
ncbi:LysR family transcriptional regulator [Occallatibacter riparius]|uniref:LysR family transcriptional regulator n=1 Tax=Occallatibacter riparius TaxID=1002689 RepID=A0A9J7BIM9_9BACT|nr:LysR family transcriptional regulator [Occallatibacter riparius]UWZ82788.1 LysR family transcriptional regulator [Occallatibacter riparius]